MNPRSIRFQLAAWYALVLTLTLAAVGVGMWSALRGSIHDTMDKDLRARMAEMREYVDKQAREPGSGSLADELAEQAALAPGGARFRMAGANGEWIYQAPGTFGWNPRSPTLVGIRQTGRTETLIIGGKPIRVLTAPLALGVAQLGIPIDEYYEMLDEFSWTVLLASPVVLVLASVGGFWMSRRALEPVSDIARRADLIGAQNLSERLTLRGAGDELDRLSNTLNGMFERLEESFRRIMQFTADASHELRTPVAIIRTTAELARSKPRSEQEYERALDSILAESERTSRLLEDLMLLARADAGVNEMIRESVDASNLLRDVSSEVTVLAEAAGVHVTVGECPQANVSGDEQALHRLFLILLDNALKYTPRGGEVSVSLSVGSFADASMATIEFRDSGVGISEEDLPHIFERFYRASKDRSRQSGGVGLGLSIAQWIALRHGGDVLVESKPGFGSTFRVRLPIE